MKKNIGIVGDGQLAKMLITSGIPYGHKFYVLPLKKINPQESICYGLASIVSSYQELALNSDVITYEIDSVPLDELEKIVKTGIEVIPSPRILSIIQSKIEQKEFYFLNNLPTLTHYVFSTYQEFKEITKYTTGGLIIKREFGGYNGKGVLKYYCDSPYSEQDPEEFFKGGGRYSLEELLDLKMEISVIVARDHYGNIVTYHPMKMTFDNQRQILEYQESLTGQDKLVSESQEVAKRLVEKMDGIGLSAIEFLVGKDYKLYINETSPRPHNSGHHTIISTTNQTSQYQQLLRILNHKNVLQPTENYALMCNILGSEDLVNSRYDYDYQILEELEEELADVSFEFNDYGKELTFPYRKLGHCTLSYSWDNYVSIDGNEIFQKMSRIVIPKKNNLQNKINLHKLNLKSDSRGYFQNQEHLEISKTKVKFDLSQLHDLEDFKHGNQPPVVGIIMGSISDYPVMKEACQILEDFNIPYEKRVVSAHRTPYEMIAYGTYTLQRGLKVIIAGAGGAAHLPGMTASVTNLPVIGVPIKSSNMSGLDSLYSIVQMPRGVPVATMAINGSMNAGLMALKILATNNEYKWLNTELDQYRQELNKKSVESNQELI